MRRFAIRFFCVIFGWATLVPSASGQTGGSAPLRLSRRQAIEEALARNPGILASREQVEQARAQVAVARALPEPSLVADVAGQTRALNPGSGNASDIGLGLTFPFPGKIRLRGEVATAALRAAEFTLEQLRQQVASQAAEAYDAILVALRHGEDLKESKELALDFLAKTKARFLAGTVPRVDVVKAQVDVSQAENDAIANERALATARASLNRLLGRTGGASVETTDSLEVPASIAELERLEKLAEASRPEIRSLEIQRQGARAATRLAHQYWLPDINVTLTRNAMDGSPTTYTTGIGLGFPIFPGQHRQGEIAAALHREQELAANAVDVTAQVSLDVRTSYASASTALRQAIFIRDELLPEAREVYRVASVSYGLGGSSALDLLDAKRTLLDAEKQYVDALGAANDAQAALELAVGAPLPPSSGEKRGEKP
ncbi:MAG: outer membrane protein heavy metal efflux system [Acidobacteriota bacterium]|nr:outer membrane protein heavy metal efflux system [Acidobacteriota bacterium]